jgi:hypothetical protein
MPYLIFTSKSKRRVTDADAEGDLSVVCALLSERTVSQSPAHAPVGNSRLYVQDVLHLFPSQHAISICFAQLVFRGLVYLLVAVHVLLPWIRAPMPAPTRFLECCLGLGW